MLASLITVAALGGCSTEGLALRSETPIPPPLCADLLAIVAAPDADLEAAAQRARDSGMFRAVRCTEGDAGVVCDLRPHTLVRSIELEGAPFPLLDGDLKHRVGLRPGAPWTAARRDEVGERLAAELERRGFYGARVEVEAAVAPASGLHPTVDIAIQISNASSHTLGDVSIAGDSAHLDATRARDELAHDWLPGLLERRFSPERAEEDVRELERSLRDGGHPGARIELRHSVDPATGAVDVVLDVRAGPSLEVELRGVHELDADDLREELTFAERGIVDTIELDAGAQGIRGACQRAGYYAASVEAALRWGAGGDAVAVFTIDEGAYAEVTALRIEGNRSLDDEQLRGDVALRLAPDWIGATHWVDAVARADGADLEERYREAGFGQVEVTPRYEELEPGALAAVFEVAEGPRRLVERVELEGLPPPGEEEEVRGALELRAGAALRDDAIDNDRRWLVGYLGRLGYLDASVEVGVEGEGDAVVVVRMTPGERQRFGGLLLRGNLSTRDGYFDSQLAVEPGDIAFAGDIVDATARLRRSGLFSSVDVERVTDAAKERSWLAVGVNEAPTTTVDLVASFNTDDLFAVGFEARDRNLLGYALDLSLDASFANASGWGHRDARIGNRDDLAAGLRARRPVGVPFDVSLTGSYLREDKALFERTIFTGRLAFARDLLSEGSCSWCPAVLGQVGYRLDASDFVVADIEERLDVGRVFIDLDARRLDSLVDPRRGWQASARLELALAELSPGPGASLWRVMGSASAFWPLGVPIDVRDDEGRPWVGPVVVAGGATLQHGGVFGATERLPLSEAFAYGGGRSLRGASERASAVAWPHAAHVWAGQLELRWYFLENTGYGSLQIAALTDVATAAEPIGDLFSEGTVSSGLGVRWITPVGPLSVAYAWPWRPARSIVGADPAALPREGRLHVGFGGSF